MKGLSSRSLEKINTSLDVRIRKDYKTSKLRGRTTIRKVRASRPLPSDTPNYATKAVAATTKHLAVERSQGTSTSGLQIPRHNSPDSTRRLRKRIKEQQAPEAAIEAVGLPKEYAPLLLQEDRSAIPSADEQVNSTEACGGRQPVESAQVETKQAVETEGEDLSQAEEEGGDEEAEEDQTDETEAEAEDEDGVEDGGTGGGEEEVEGTAEEPFKEGVGEEGKGQGGILFGDTAMVTPAGEGFAEGDDGRTDRGDNEVEVGGGAGLGGLGGACAVGGGGREVRISREWQATADDIKKNGEAIPLRELTGGSNRGRQLAASEPVGSASDGVQAHAPVVVVCGTKNVGKSTFATFLVNELLQKYPKVAFLETDVGQPEFSAPGCLSLHLLSARVSNLPRVQLLDPLRCYFYGDVTPKQDPEKYLRCVLALYSFFRDHLQRPQPQGVTGVARADGHVAAATPLVINTNGWIRGLGLDILIDILRHVIATHVVQIDSPLATKNLPPGAFWEVPSGMPSPTQILHIHSALSTEEQRKGQQGGGGVDNRNLRVLALLRSACRLGPPVINYSEEGAVYTETARALVHVRPYMVPLTGIRIIHLHGYVPPGQSLTVANAALVGLAVRSTGGSGHVQAGTVTASQNVPGGNAGTQGGVSVPEMNNDLPLCIGLGLIRSIDEARGSAYVITGLPFRELRRVNAFVVGRIEMPVRLLQWGPYSSPYLCHNSIAAEGTGSAPIRSRNNLLRRTTDV